ncbi:MAG: arginine--tRNA ligase [Candidatus Liptonbacteria bacterium RIFCSPLOWO2_01_FULL_53_13]|uniref:Arginine--tRNA ligase n=1 Tax=Candidatus Liptonbacteria bacterium RIFCSPLOWO2_01_FULL_53_13 TaxID=1798651 RepID=A0A1G2CL60_9BACT|nr:MAG: arginine--tRNA ligase [Candidatus Liptonbacteria bacterium RIFCSPLOWO2_01_FULL_53_13]
MIREQIEEILAKAAPEGAAIELSVPEREEFGHYSTNAAMRMAARGLSRKGAADYADKLKAKIEKIAPKGFFEKVEVAPPGFINFWVTKEIIQKELGEIAQEKDAFGENAIGKKQKVIVEYSSPNIAKPMHAGHLRNTVLGDALANLYAANGYDVIRWNYPGDWGTQFGKLIAAYKLWGEKSAIEKKPIQEMLSLYVRFHDEAKRDSALEEKGREEFQKLEEGDEENRKLWEWFKEESFKEFNRVYALLGIKFDVTVGESFFEGDLDGVIKELMEKGLAKESEGALIVPLEQFGLPPALARKSDGASLYLTRDIALLEYRIKKYKPVRILHIIGNEQSLYFEQLAKTAALLGVPEKQCPVHVKYGLVLDEGGKKFATREGRAIFLDEIMEKAIALARNIVEEKNSELGAEEKEHIAEAVALGALKYTMLKENRTSDITFNWKNMLDFTGDSGPYLQYTYARLRSILRKAEAHVSSVKCQVSSLDTECELALIRKLAEFPHAVRVAAEALAPNALALYAYELANLANRFYEAEPILTDENTERKSARLLLVEVAARVLARGLGLLGIKTLEKI